ncbi:hypothetical protein CF645_38190, partial [Burkholderia pseudomallei]
YSLRNGNRLSEIAVGEEILISMTFTFRLVPRPICVRCHLSSARPTLSASLACAHRLARGLVRWLWRFVPIPVTLSRRERMRSRRLSVTGIGTKRQSQRTRPRARR